MTYQTVVLRKISRRKELPEHAEGRRASKLLEVSLARGGTERTTQETQVEGQLQEETDSNQVTNCHPPVETVRVGARLGQARNSWLAGIT